MKRTGPKTLAEYAHSPYLPVMLWLVRRMQEQSKCEEGLFGATGSVASRGIENEESHSRAS